MKQPFLVGERVYLRGLDESDLTDEYLGWLNDHEITAYLEATGHFPATSTGLKSWLEKYQDSRRNLALAIIDKESDRHIGNITLNDIDWMHRTAWIGIMVGCKEFQGRGYGAEAESLLIEHSFKRLHLRKIMHAAAADNIGGVKLPQKLGFQVEGILRKQYFMEGKYSDGVVMGVFADEFRKYVPNSVLSSHESETPAQSE